MTNYSTLLNLTKEVEATTNVINTGNNWVQQNYSILYNEPTLSVNSEGYEYDVSDYLPNNNDTYEVLLKVSAEKGNMHFDTDAIQDFFGFYSQTANSTNGIAVIGPQRTLKIRVYAECQNVYVTLCGYKKVSSSVSGIGTSMLANNNLSNITSSAKELINALYVPSLSKSKSVTLGADRATYVAPCNGYLALNFNTTKTISYLAVYQGGYLWDQKFWYKVHNDINAYFFIQKGNYIIAYDGIQIYQGMWFVPCKGEEYLVN